MSSKQRNQNISGFISQDDNKGGTFCKVLRCCLRMFRAFGVVEAGDLLQTMSIREIKIDQHNLSLGSGPTSNILICLYNCWNYDLSFENSQASVTPFQEFSYILKNSEARMETIDLWHSEKCITSEL